MPENRTTKTNENMDITGIIAIIFTFSSAFGIVYVVMSTRHRERMAMIERGITPDGASSKPDPEKSLKGGMQLIAVAIGLGCGYALNVYTDIERPWVYLGPVVFCVGVVMILYYFRSKNKA